MLQRKSDLTTLLLFLVLTLLLAACAPSAGSSPASNPADASGATEAIRSLNRVHAAPDQTTVSGVSAGAYMATQLQVAFSRTFQGLGSIAGGPWNCSNGLWWNATSRCMESPSYIDIDSLLQDLKSSEGRGAVDPLVTLQSKRIYLLNSPNDSVVRPPMAEKNAAFFSALVKAQNIYVERRISPGHSFPTLDYGLPCDQSGSPYLSACGFDTAGALLRQLYPNRELKRAAADKNSLYVFDQTKFGESAASLSKEGWVYVPRACLADTARCPLHVAFHGCSQGSDAVKDVFVLHAGYNEWAEGSDLIILYPQTYARAFVNPKGCFDWFGYTGPSSYATKQGAQMKAIKAMVDLLTKD